jgi:hypothetical protein
MDHTAKRYSFTQPICNGCWDEQHPDRRSVRMLLCDHEICCYCGTDTQSGIYARVDPDTVPHPSMEKS